MRSFEVEERADWAGTKAPALAFVWWALAHWGMGRWLTVAVFGETGAYREVSHVIQYAE